MAAPTWVQNPASGADANATSTTLAFGSNVTAGNSIFVGIRIGATDRTITVSDTLSNTYGGSPGTVGDVAQTQTTDGHRTYLFSAHNIAGGACTVTVAISGAAATIRFNIGEGSFGGTASLDKTASAEGSGTDPASGNTATTTIDDELVVGVASNAAATAWTAGGTYTERGNAPADPNGRTAMETLIVAATGVQNATWTITGTKTWAAVVGTYGIAGGGEPPLTWLPRYDAIRGRTVRIVPSGFNPGTKVD